VRENDMLLLFLIFLFQKAFSGAMPKRKGRGRPKGSRVQKKVKESEDGELVIPNTPLKVLKVDPDFIEEHEEGIHKLTLSYYPFYLFYYFFFLVRSICLLFLYINFVIQVLPVCLRRKDGDDQNDHRLRIFRRVSIAT